MNNNEEPKLTLQEQIQNLFSTYTQKRLHPRIIDRLKQMLKENLTQIISQACRYSLLRDNFTNSLDEKDLLYAVQKRGTKYKSAVAYSLVKRGSIGSAYKGGMQAGGVEQQNNDEQAD